MTNRRDDRPVMAILVVLALLPAAVFGEGPPRSLPVSPRSLTLEEAVRIGLENSRRLAVARTAEESAVEEVKEARAAFFPEISLQASYVRLDEAPYIPANSFLSLLDGFRSPFESLVRRGVLEPAALEGIAGGPRRVVVGDENNYAAGLRLKQPLFTGFALRGAYESAKRRSEAERWSVRREEEGVRFEVSAAYYDLVKARALTEVARESRERLAAHLRDLEVRREEGALLQVDLLRGKVELSRAKLEESRAGNGTGLAASRLCHLLGLPVDTPLDPAETPGTLGALPDDPAGMGAVARDRRADRAALLAAIEAARAGARVPRGRFYPNLFFVGSYDWKRPDREFEDDFYDSWNVGLALDWTLFDGGARRSRVGRASLEESRLRELLGLLDDSIAIEVKHALLFRREAVEALALAEEQCAAAEEFRRVVREAFDGGAATATDLLDAETMLTAARGERVFARADLHLAEARLAHAVGMHLEADGEGLR
ncbi:MAG: TolC family protein [Candidatus Eisenbacteria bacterium]